MAKINFLSVYVKAHLEALSKENIVSAFKKMRVVPFNLNVITVIMLALSRTSSVLLGLPLTLTSPVQVVADYIDCYLACQARLAESDVKMDDRSGSDNESFGILTSTCVAIAELQSISLLHLVSSLPPKSSFTLLLFQPNTILPFKLCNKNILAVETGTELEKYLQQALIKAKAQDEAKKCAMVAMQGITVLQKVYVWQNN